MLPSASASGIPATYRTVLQDPLYRALFVNSQSHKASCNPIRYVLVLRTPRAMTVLFLSHGGDNPTTYREVAMLTYRVCDDEGVIRYQGTDYAKATECLASFWDDCQDYATIETRDVEPCGHYGHSRWIDRKTAYDYYGI